MSDVKKCEQSEPICTFLVQSSSKLSTGGTVLENFVYTIIFNVWFQVRAKGANFYISCQISIKIYGMRYRDVLVLISVLMFDFESANKVS